MQGLEGKPWTLKGGGFDRCAGGGGLELRTQLPPTAVPASWGRLPLMWVQWLVYGLPDAPSASAEATALPRTDVGLHPTVVTFLPLRNVILHSFIFPASKRCSVTLDLLNKKPRSLPSFPPPLPLLPISFPRFPISPLQPIASHGSTVLFS